MSGKKSGGDKKLIRIKVKVTTRSSRPRVEEGEDCTLKVYLASAPEKGKANSELEEVVSGYLGVRRGTVRVVHGFKSREKLLEVEIHGAE